jgi:hypothetical protein
VQVDPEGEATEEQYREVRKLNIPREKVARAKNYGRSKETWYFMLREIQFEPKYYLDGTVKYWPLENGFLEDDIFCEWGYVIDLNKEALEIYRYGNMVGCISLDEVRENDIDAETYEKFYDMMYYKENYFTEEFAKHCKTKSFPDEKTFKELFDEISSPEVAIEIFNKLDFAGSVVL